jgi:hypothetical protein
MWRETMNNPGMDLEIWRRLRKKWTDLDTEGHKLKIDFQLIADPKDAKKILAIDVIQYIDGKTITETVQRIAGEGYAPLGIAKLSNEGLKEIYKKMMQELRDQSKLSEIDVMTTMRPTSPTSGELRGYLEVPNAPVQTSLQLNYYHYYVLNALRDKMIEQTGKSWSQVRAVYHSSDLEFYFEY